MVRLVRSIANTVSALESQPATNWLCALMLVVTLGGCVQFDAFPDNGGGAPADEAALVGEWELDSVSLVDVGEPVSLTLTIEDIVGDGLQATLTDTDEISSTHEVRLRDIGGNRVASFKRSYYWELWSVEYITLTEELNLFPVLPEAIATAVTAGEISGGVIDVGQERYRVTENQLDLHDFISNETSLFSDTGMHFSRVVQSTSAANWNATNEVVDLSVMRPVKLLGDVIVFGGPPIIFLIALGLVALKWRAKPRN